jgi:hypothetical protein
MVDGGAGRGPFGGVGGLPVEGLTTVSIEGSAFSLGFRNISRGLCRHAVGDCLRHGGWAITAA